MAKAAKIDKNVTSLTARHTFACYLLNERKLSIEVVSKMLGHSSIKESQHYSKLLDNSVFEANAGGQDTMPISSPKKHKAPEISAEMEDTEVFEKLLGIENEEVV